MDEPLRMSVMGCLEDRSTCITLLLDAAMVKVCWREKSDAGMTMLVIVPLNKPSAEFACLFEVENGRDTTGDILRSWCVIK